MMTNPAHANAYVRMALDNRRAMLDLIEAKEFSVCSAMIRTPMPVSERYPAGWESSVEYFLWFNPFKSETEEPALAFARERWDNVREVHVYPRTYIKKARQLHHEGRWVLPVDGEVQTGGFDMPHDRRAAW
jgi:hypothetical protein